MSLAATLGIWALLAAPQYPATHRVNFVFQEEQKPPATDSSKTGQKQEEPAKEQPTPLEQPAPPTTPGADSTTPAQSPQTETAKPVETVTPPATTQKPPVKAHAGKTPAKKRRVKHKVPANPSAPSKVVVRNGGASDPPIQFSSGAGKQQTSQQVQNTSSLLDATTANLKKVSNRQLAPSQQDMVKQIHIYMEQSKTAAGRGDLQGAQNLAFKAHLLSEELVKR